MKTPLLLFALIGSTLAATTFVFKNRCIVDVDVILGIEAILGKLKPGEEMSREFSHRTVLIGSGHGGHCGDCYVGNTPISLYFVGAHLNYMWRPEDMMVTDEWGHMVRPPMPWFLTSLTIEHSSGPKMRCSGNPFCEALKIFVPTDGTFTERVAFIRLHEKKRKEANARKQSITKVVSLQSRLLRGTSVFIGAAHLFYVSVYLCAFFTHWVLPRHHHLRLQKPLPLGRRRHSSHRCYSSITEAWRRDDPSEHQIVFFGTGNDGHCGNCNHYQVPMSPFYVGASLNYLWRPEFLMEIFNDASGVHLPLPWGLTSITIEHSSGS
ncbi:hypothetical protein L596_023381 [Steinernema carpocapsae]|uniref:Uncharacterized protein n=1 Tax=Steinernema carpocapsae TaxID=34508 RepID=A0A4V5ZZE3_STECR|nr:hypothetical protein L596_023381 [Steinernema carpocapsae]